MRCEANFSRTYLQGNFCGGIALSNNVEQIYTAFLLIKDQIVKEECVKDYRAIRKGTNVWLLLERLRALYFATMIMENFDNFVPLLPQLHGVMDILSKILSWIAKVFNVPPVPDSIHPCEILLENGDRTDRNVINFLSLFRNN